MLIWINQPLFLNMGVFPPKVMNPHLIREGYLGGKQGPCTFRRVSIQQKLARPVFRGLVWHAL